MNEVSPTYSVYSGYLYEPIEQSLHLKESSNFEEMGRVTKKLEKESKKVQAIYNAKGKLVKYYSSGKYLDFFA